MKLKPGSLDILIGANIRRCRLDAGIKQQELAATIGVSFQQIQRYEQGLSKIPASTLIEVAEILKVPVHDLFGVEAEPLGKPAVEDPDYDEDRLFVAVKTLRSPVLRETILGLIDDWVEVSISGPRKDEGPSVE